jgi:hypothetical protein
MNANSRAIYASRPWTVFGEGPSVLAQEPLRAQGFNEGRNKPYTSEDLRFVQKAGKALRVRARVAGVGHAHHQVTRCWITTCPR